jgi:hypothetical protein
MAPAISLKGNVIAPKIADKGLKPLPGGGQYAGAGHGGGQLGIQLMETGPQGGGPIGIGIGIGAIFCGGGHPMGPQYEA